MVLVVALVGEEGKEVMEDTMEEEEMGEGIIHRRVPQPQYMSQIRRPQPIVTLQPLR